MDEERLIRLFWNRAALKKEFSKLRDERARVTEQLRQQEAATLRVQERLESLENLLADRERAANAAVYYQLRGLWGYARNRLRRLADDVSRQQLKREISQHRGAFENARANALAMIDQRIARLKAKVDEHSGQRQVIADELARRRGFWNFFRRRKLKEQMQPFDAALGTLKTQMDRYLEARAAKQQEQPAKLDGISVEGRRAINLVVIAMGQELVLFFDELGHMARDASARSVADADFGEINRCYELCDRIARQIREAEKDAELGTRVNRRATFLRQACQYRRDIDVVPIAGSIAAIPRKINADFRAATDAGPPVAVNLLADEFWDVYSILVN